MKIEPWKGTAGTVMRPLKKNMKTPPKGAVLTDCPRCGEKCYKLPTEPDPLPENLNVACSVCALLREKPKK